MKRRIILGVCIIGSLCFKPIPAEILSPERKIEWQPGIPGQFPEKIYTVNVMDFGAVRDGVTDDHPAFVEAIAALPEEGGIVFIPAGHYFLHNTVTIDRGILLRGEGPDQTHLTFDLGDADSDCILIVKYSRGDWIHLQSGYVKGSRKLVVEDVSPFLVGQFVEMQQDNDPECMLSSWFYDPWGHNAVGQINIVEAIQGDTLFLDRDIYFSYKAELNPMIRSQGFVQYAGIEKMRLDRADQGDGQIIHVKNAAFCRIHDVETFNATRSHVYLETVYGCEVSHSYFHHARSLPTISYGDGVVCCSHSTDNLIEDNIFRHVRHAMMVHLGSSGNVFAFNYSFEPYVPDTWHPACISLKGHYPNFNLFESNVVEEISVSDYGGPVGPGNTFFRNRIVSGNLTIQEYSHGQNVVGNLFCTSFQKIVLDSTILNTMIHGNVFEGSVEWDPEIADYQIPNSYYYGTKPEFLEDKPWPLFGPNGDESATLPAQDRFDALQSTSGVKTALSVPSDMGLDVYPNPCNPTTNIVYHIPEKSHVTIQVLDMTGRRIETLVDASEEVGTRNLSWSPRNASGAPLPSGVYFIHMIVGNITHCKKVMIVR